MMVRLMFRLNVGSEDAPGSTILGSGVLLHGLGVACRLVADGALVLWAVLVLMAVL